MSCSIKYRGVEYKSTADFIKAVLEKEDASTVEELDQAFFIEKFSEKAANKRRKELGELPPEVLEFDSSDSLKGSQINSLIASMEESVEKEVAEVKNKAKNKAQKIIREVKKKELQNIAIDIYKSIYSSPDDRIQRQINKVLSMEAAEKTVAFTSSVSKTKKSKFFSPLDSETQRKQSLSGADGQLGIGVHSNAVVIHNLAKAVGGVPFGKIFSVGKLQTNNGIGFEKTSGRRIVSDVNTENQNSATDNVKAGIMSKRNENAFTINSLVMMTLKGLDLTPKGFFFSFVTDTGEVYFSENEREHIEKKREALQAEKKIVAEADEISVPSLILQQPVLKEYVEAMKKAKSVSRVEEREQEEAIIERLFKKYGSSTPEETNSYPTLTAQNLVQNLKENTVSNEVQVEALGFFLAMKKEADTLGLFQRTINLNSTGLGVSYLGVKEREKNLEKILKESKEKDVNIFEGFTSIIGKRSQEGFNFNTPVGRTLNKSLSLSNKLLKVLYPVESLFHTGLEEHIFSNFEGEFFQEKLKAKNLITSHFKQFLHAKVLSELYPNERVQDMEEKLFLTSGGKISLPFFLKNLQKEKHPYILNNNFFNSLEPKIAKLTGEYDSIFGRKEERSSLASRSQEQSFILAYNDTTTVLGRWEGKEMTPRDLCIELFKLAALSDQQGGATGFFSSIPYSFLKQVGYVEKMSRISEESINNQGTVEYFFKQYYRNSQATQKVGTTLTEESFKSTVGSYKYENESKEKVFAVTHKKEFGGNTFKISEKQVLNNLHKLSSLSVSEPIFGEVFNHTSYGKDGARKVLYIWDELNLRYENVTEESVNPLVPRYYTREENVYRVLRYEKGFQRKAARKSGKEVLLSALENRKIVPEKFEGLVEALLPFLNKTLSFEDTSNTSSLGESVGKYLPAQNKIQINLEEASKEGNETVFTEEVIHAAFRSILKQNATLVNKKWVAKNDAATEIKTLLYIYGKLQEKVQEDLNDTKNGNITEDNRKEILYYSQNFEEFVAGAFVNEKFAAYVDSLAEGGGLLETLRKLLLKIIDNITGKKFSSVVQDLTLKSFNYKVRQELEESAVRTFTAENLEIIGDTSLSKDISKLKPKLEFNKQSEVFISFLNGKTKEILLTSSEELGVAKQLVERVAVALNKKIAESVEVGVNLRSLTNRDVEKMFILQKKMKNGKKPGYYLLLSEEGKQFSREVLQNVFDMSTPLPKIKTVALTNQKTC